jgi:DNA-binding GntR family transcriptional regulator
VSVLADRLAAALVHHEPGWRLPRHSALARRYNVSAAEIDAAVEELASRHLVRRLADGQVYRASPAEYVIDLEGIAGLATRLDAMGAEFACRSRQVSWRLPPEDIAWALRMPADQQVCVVRYLWTADSVPAALITTYVPGDIASRADTSLTSGSASVLNLFQLAGVPGGATANVELEGTVVGLAGADPAVTGSLAADSDPVGAATALHLELQAPPPSVARSLRLGAGQPAMIVTIRFDEAASGRPVALSIAVLRPEMFRLVLQTPFRSRGESDAGHPPGSWAHAVEGWEP